VFQGELVFEGAVDGREHCKSFKGRLLADGFLTD
jgi:hypothetical protein